MLDICKSVNVRQYTNRIKDKSQVIISVDTEQPSTVKIPGETENRRNRLQMMTAIHDSPMDSLTLILTRAMWQEEELKRVQIGKEEVKLSLFAD
jgi:hypothetical protein